MWFCTTAPLRAGFKNRSGSKNRSRYKNRSGNYDKLGKMVELSAGLVFLGIVDVDIDDWTVCGQERG